MDSMPFWTGGSDLFLLADMRGKVMGLSRHQSWIGLSEAGTHLARP